MEQKQIFLECSQVAIGVNYIQARKNFGNKGIVLAEGIAVTGSAASADNTGEGELAAVKGRELCHKGFLPDRKPFVLADSSMGMKTLKIFLGNV